jgi:hypothetical protein
VNEAMALLSAMRLAKGSAERKQRRLESIKPSGPIVTAPNESEPEVIIGDDDI